VATQVQKTLTVADHVFCVSDALTEKANKIATHSNISTVPIGANPENFPTDQEEQLRGTYGISPETTVILFCGQFIERKGIADIIDSLHEFPSENVEYIFVGHSGTLTEELRVASNSQKSPANIRIYTGLDTDTLREWYAISDLLLLPSYAEGRPTVIYEAMAAETAVLSTQIKGISEQVDTGETGQLISPGDTKELVDLINQMARDPANLVEMGKKGKMRLISNGWTWTNNANRIVSIHKNLY
jgi:glycosyltransferase involved in cell wall biosynthesis